MAYTSTDGYYNNTYLGRDDSNDSDQLTGRAKFVFLPENGSKMTLGIYVDQLDSAFDRYGPVEQGLSHDTRKGVRG